MSLRKRVHFLVAAAVLPLSSLLAYDAYDSWRTLRGQANRTALDQARQLAGTMDALLDGARQLAQAVALHMSEVGSDTATCSGYLRAVVATERRYFGLAVLRPDGSVMCSATPAPPGLSVADREYFQAALEAKSIVVGDAVLGRAVGQWSLPLALSYRDENDRVAGIVVMPLNLEELAKTLSARFSHDQAFLLLADGNGRAAARVPDHGATVGRPVPQPLDAAMTAPRVIEHADYRGRPHIIGVATVMARPRNLTVLVGLDREAAFAPAREALWRSAVGGGLVIGLAILAAWFVGRRLIERPVRAFVDVAQRHAAGDLQSRFPEGRPGTEFGRLGAALNAMAGEIERLVGQKTLLIREVQHRVMNSLQLLAAFLHLQSRQVDDPAVRKHLKDARERIVSMSVIYRHLYHSEAASTVDFAETLKALCEETARAYMDGDAATIAVDAESVPLPMQAALSLALITHELVTNAVKHGYASGAGGPLHISLQRRGDRVELAVADEGKGLPPDFAPERARSLGMAVILNLTRQLRGTFAAERLPRGARFVVSFPTADAPRASGFDTAVDAPSTAKAAE